MTFIKKIILVLAVSLVPGYVLTAQTNHWETAIFAGDTWKYFVGNAEPNAFWRLAAFDDKDWKSGKGGIGYGDNDDSTIIEACYSLFLRRSFMVTDTAKISASILNIDYDDAFVAYINGIEVARSGITGAYPPYNAAGADHEAKMYSGGLPEEFTISKQLLSKTLVNGINQFAIQVHNSSISSSDLSAIPFLSFGITNATKYYQPTPPWFKGKVDQAIVESNIPLIAINTLDNQVIQNNGTKVTAILRVIDRGKGLLNHLSDSANNFYGYIGIEIRGSTSAIYPQKGYGFETRDSAGKNRNVKLLGMPKDNDWTLIANYNDKALSRNTLTHQLFRSMGYYAPRSMYCEVFVNNDYQGIYMLMEKIKQDSNRVNIAKLDSKATSGDKLTGGYILKNDTKDANESSFFSDYDEQGQSNSQQISFLYADPKSSDITDPQKIYLNTYMRSLENAIYGNNFKDPRLGYRAYLDTLSFIDYFIIGEVSRSVDAYKKSKFFFKDIDSRGGLLHSGPTWDFDWAYKNIPEGDISKECFFGVTDGSAWAYKSIYCVHYPAFPAWIPRLMQDSSFLNDIKTRYIDFRKTILSNTSIYHTLDSIQVLLTEPQKRHYQKWDILGKVTQGSPETDPQPTTFEGAEQQLKNWINTRLTWLDGHMPGTYQPHGTVASKEYAREITIKIFPNPAQAHVYIESAVKINSIDLYSLLGVKMHSESIHSNVANIKLDDLPLGYYFLHTYLENGRSGINKLIVQ